jgi:cellulose synthase/poly-beta-1,6-N-acetylglucosamine synthase-like glycosyltransferase
MTDTLTVARDAEARSGAASAAPDPTRFLPQPPGDLERDLYLGKRQRWVAPMSFLGFVLIVISVGFFVYRHEWAAFLLVPLAITSTGAVVSRVTSSRGRRDSLGSHRRRVESWAPGRYPAVDVFLPSAGESLDVLANTYRHVAALDWPGELTVYVLDDSGRPVVEEMARRHGFSYLSRPDRGHFKKAGNLRFGFDHSDGDLILILDADFVPRPDAVRELAPYFDDSDVGIVQSPQFFDVDAGMNWLQRAAGSTQMLFYRWVQPSRDRSNAAICVGTSALYRRAALVRAGGYALIGHSEDVHTGVKLVRAGFRVRYVATIVTKGLCPDDLHQFATQQYRWCTGSMSLLFSKQFHRTRLSPMQRLSYFSGFLYYITTAVNAFVMTMPPILMAWFVAAKVTPANYVFVLLALVVRQSVIPVITLGSESLVGLARVQTMYSFCHALAIYDTLRGRTDAWVATGTGGSSRTSARVLKLVRRWCIAVQVALWSAILWFVPVYGLERWWLMVAFTLMNLYVVFPLLKGSADVPTLADLPRLTRTSWAANRELRPGVSAPVVALDALRLAVRRTLAEVRDPMHGAGTPTPLTWLQKLSSARTDRKSS